MEANGSSNISIREENILRSTQNRRGGPAGSTHEAATVSGGSATIRRQTSPAASGDHQPSQPSEGDDIGDAKEGRGNGGGRASIPSPIFHADIDALEHDLPHAAQASTVPQDVYGVTHIASRQWRWKIVVYLLDIISAAFIGLGQQLDAWTLFAVAITLLLFTVIAVQCTEHYAYEHGLAAGKQAGDVGRGIARGN